MQMDDKQWHSEVEKCLYKTNNEIENNLWMANNEISKCVYICTVTNNEIGTPLVSKCVYKTNSEISM